MKVLQMAQAWASGAVKAREDGTVVSEPHESSADTKAAEASGNAKERRSRSAQGDVTFAPRIAASALLRPSHSVPPTNTVRDAFGAFLEADDLPEMREHFSAAVAAVGMQRLSNDPNFYVLLRGALLPQLNFKQKAIFKVSGSQRRVKRKRGDVTRKRSPRRGYWQPAARQH